MAVEFRDRGWFADGQIAETRNLCEVLGCILVLCDDLKHEVFQPDKDQRGLPEGSLREVLPIPLEVTAATVGVYIRLHRRQGVHRVLAPQEFAAWRERLLQLRAKVSAPIFFLWGTDHEDAAMVNARRLREACDSPDSSDSTSGFFLDWKAQVKDYDSKRGTSLLSYFSSPGHRRINGGNASVGRGEARGGWRAAEEEAPSSAGNGNTSLRAHEENAGSAIVLGIDEALGRIFAGEARMHAGAGLVCYVNLSRTELMACTSADKDKVPIE